MLILHVVAPAEIGGLERVVAMLAPGQARAGHDVHVAAVVDTSCVEPPLLSTLADGVTTHAIALPARAYGRERAAVKELCRRLRPDIVHTHGYRPDVVDSGVPRRLGIPTVTTVHGFTGGGFRNRLYERLQRRAYRSFDAVVVVSGPLATQLRRERVPADRIGWVGRLGREKGPDVLLDGLVHLTDLPLSVSIVGNGAEQRSLRARAERLGVERIVQWHGLVPDVGRLFAAFDVFVLSSRTEGTPMVLFEAMAAGVPIVAARVGGVPDVVSSSDATLVPPADPVALAKAIRAICRDPGVASGRARRARERLYADFTLPPWIARYDAIYRRVSNKALAWPA